MGVLITLPQSKLTLSRDNIRKSQPSKTSDKELKASIAAQGVLQSLLVSAPAKKSGKYIIHAGARRFRLATELIKEGKLDKGFEFPCHVSDSEHPEEAALSENMHREGMHPVDEFETFHHLHFKAGMTIPEIAADFGKPKIDIQKRLKLAGVHPTLRDLCRAGKLDIDALEAYSISDDQEQQMKAFESLKGWEQKHPHYIRKALTQSCYPSDHKLVKFIGLQNYTKAGGTTSTDLFNGVKYLHDVDLIEKLAKEKLEEAAGEAQGDWKWVDIDLDFYNKAIPHTRMKPETQYTEEQTEKKAAIEEKIKGLNAEIDKLENSETEDEDHWEKLSDIEEKIYGAEEELEAIEKEAQHYTADQMASAGCIVTLDHDGAVIVERGFVKKEDQKEADKASPGNGGKAAKKPEQAEYSTALETDLQAWRLAAAKTELIYNTDIMARLALFSLCWELFKPERLYEPNACNIRIEDTFTESSKKDIRESRMHQELLEYRSKLDLSWIKETTAESWEAFQGIDDKALNKMLAFTACYSLNGSLRPHQDESPNVLDLVLDAVDGKLGKHWRPDRNNFFSRINRATAEEEGKVICNDDEFPDLHKAKPKSEIEVLLEERVAGMTNDDCWLPAGF